MLELNSLFGVSLVPSLMTVLAVVLGALTYHLVARGSRKDLAELRLRVHKTSVRLTEQGVLVDPGEAKHVLQWTEIIGVKADDNNVVCITALKHRLGQETRRQLVVCRIACGDQPTAQKLVSQMDASAFGTSARTRTMVVICNPVSGNGTSLRVLEEFQKHLQVPGAHTILTDVRFTQRAGHAFEMGASWDGEADIVALVGGDGLLHEFANGFLQEEGKRKEGSQPILALVPAGTGNGLAKTLALNPFDAQEAAFRVLRGHSRKVDAIRVSTNGPFRAAVEQGSQPTLQRFCFCSLTYGIIADVDHDSERFRSLGSLRFHLESFLKIISFVRKPASIDISGIVATFLGTDLVHGLPREESERVFPRFDMAASRVRSDLSEEARAQVQALKPAACSVNGPFVGIIVANVATLSHDMNFAPWGCPTDGYMDVMLLPSISRWQLLIDLFLRVDAGTHVDTPTCRRLLHYFKAEGVVLQRPSDQSVLDIDGEFLWTSDDVHAVVQKGIIEVLM